jgi:hypothetical protein
MKSKCINRVTILQYFRQEKTAKISVLTLNAAIPVQKMIISSIGYQENRQLVFHAKLIKIA